LGLWEIEGGKVAVKFACGGVICAGGVNRIIIESEVVMNSIGAYFRAVFSTLLIETNPLES